MGESRWKDVSEGMSVAFSRPCKGPYYFMRHIGTVAACAKPDDKHAHIELSEEDGMYAFITFPCYSQTGAKIAVELLKPTLSEEECNGILALENVKALPKELTEEEKLFISSLIEKESFFSRLSLKFMRLIRPNRTTLKLKKGAIFRGWWG